MSADGSATEKTGFQRWVASLKREHEREHEHEHEHEAPAHAPVAPLVQQIGAPGGDGATRVHHFPKELMRRLRTQEGAKRSASSPPPDDRTAIFRAPPELLERANRQAAALEAEANNAPTKPPPAPSAEDSSDAHLEYMNEAASGISLRPPGLATFGEEARAVEIDEPPPPAAEAAEVPSEASLEIAEAQAYEAYDANDPFEELADADGSEPPAAEHELAAAPVLDTVNVQASLPPEFRPPIARQIAAVVVMIVLAAFFVWAAR